MSINFLICKSVKWICFLENNLKSQKKCLCQNSIWTPHSRYYHKFSKYALAPNINTKELAEFANNE
jgi:hypothetical protein